MNKIYLGIDIGTNGGISILEGTRIKTYTMPLLNDGDINIIELNAILNSIEGDKYCTIESLHCMPIWGAKGNWSFGGHYAVIKSILNLNKIPYTAVQPKKWQKEMFEGVKLIAKGDGKLDTKKTAEVAVNRIFPEFQIPTLTERSKKIHDGIVDSLLLSEYGRRNFK